MFLITKTSYDNLTRNFHYRKLLSHRKITVRFSCNQAPGHNSHFVIVFILFLLLCLPFLVNKDFHNRARWFSEYVITSQLRAWSSYSRVTELEKKLEFFWARTTPAVHSPYTRCTAGALISRIWWWSSGSHFLLYWGAPFNDIQRTTADCWSSSVIKVTFLHFCWQWSIGARPGNSRVSSNIFPDSLRTVTARRCRPTGSWRRYDQTKWQIVLWTRLRRTQESDTAMHAIFGAQVEPRAISTGFVGDVVCMHEERMKDKRESLLALLWSPARVHVTHSYKAVVR